MNWSRNVNKRAAGGLKSSLTKNNNKLTNEKRTIFAKNNSSLTILGIRKLPKDGPKYQKASTWNSPSTRAPRTSIEWERQFSTKKKISPQSDTFRKLFGHQFWFICTILFLIFNFTFFIVIASSHCHYLFVYWYNLILSYFLTIQFFHDFLKAILQNHGVFCSTSSKAIYF